MSATKTISVEALRQVAFPGFPDYTEICEEDATDTRENVKWTCTRQPQHEGPHMATYTQEDAENDVDTDIIGFAWTMEEA